MLNDRERAELEDIRREDALGQIAVMIRQYDLTAQDILLLRPSARQAGQKAANRNTALPARTFDPFFDAW